MKKSLFLLLCIFVSVSTDAQAVYGKWKTIDDETNEPKSIVEFTEENGVLTGTIVSLFREPHEEQNPICDDCTGAKKDQPIIGLPIVENMRRDGDEYNGGTITDPEDGKVYTCKLWMGSDGTLKVRGYIAFLFRTQTWYRVE
jgi:uncharacterized protein (DUF2147 family)